MMNKNSPRIGLDLRRGAEPRKRGTSSTGSKTREFDTVVCILRCTVYNGRKPEDNKREPKKGTKGVVGH